MDGTLMETKYDFTQQNNKKFVKEAENKCYEYLINEGMEVIDVSDNSKYYKYGVDLIIKEPNDKEIYIDVKADTVIHKTGNLFYELIECFFNNKRDFKIGWTFNKYLYYIYYVDVINWTLYIIPLNKLNNFVYNKEEFYCRLIPHKNYKTIGFLIPLTKIEHIITKINLN